LSQLSYSADEDYYQLLGVTPGASAQEVRRAHKKRAKECHPDVHPDTEWATAQIKRLNEASRVLSDPELKGQYDRLRWEVIGGDRTRERPLPARPAKPPKGSGGEGRRRHHEDRRMSYFIAGIEALVMLFFLVLGIYAALKKLNG